MTDARTTDKLPDPSFTNSGLDSVEYQTIATPYFQQVVGQGAAARQRSQAGFAIVSAIAGAVVAFSLSSTVQGAAELTQIFTYISLFLWAMAALFFLRAAVMQPPSTVPTDEEKSMIFDSPEKGVGNDQTELHAQAVVPAEPAQSAFAKETEDTPLPLHPLGFVAFAFRSASDDAVAVSKWTVLASTVAVFAVFALMELLGEFSLTHQRPLKPA